MIMLLTDSPFHGNTRALRVFEGIFIYHWKFTRFVVGVLVPALIKTEYRHMSGLHNSLMRRMTVPVYTLMCKKPKEHGSLFHFQLWSKELKDRDISSPVLNPHVLTTLTKIRLDFLLVPVPRVFINEQRQGVKGQSKMCHEN